MSNQRYLNVQNLIGLSISANSSKEELNFLFKEIMAYHDLFDIIVDIIAQGQLSESFKSSGLLIIEQELKKDVQMQNPFYSFNKLKQALIPMHINNIHSKSITKLIESIFRILVRKEYPKNWPNLIDDTLMLIG